MFIDGVKVAASEFAIQPDGAEVQRTVTAELEEAQRLYTERDYKAAVAACDRALQADPGNADASALRASVLQAIEILGIQ